MERLPKEAITRQRRESRDMAFKILFGRVFEKEDINDLSDVFDDTEKVNDMELSQYTRRVVIGVENHIADLDEIIKRNMSKWTINRISKVALTAMRISVYEMLFEKNVPVSVSINEAVEIVKIYATVEDSAFVNAVLGKVSREIKQSGEINNA